MSTNGVQDGNNPPYASANVNATTLGVRSSHWMITEVLVRCTNTTRAGAHCDADTKPPKKNNCTPQRDV